MNQEPFFDFVETPDPNEFAFWVRVSTDKFEPKLMPKRGETTYKDFKLPIEGASMRSGYGAYLYTKASAAATAGFMRFFFAAPKTEDEKNKPFNRFTKFDDKEWPPILLAILAVKTGFPRSTWAARDGKKTLVSGDGYTDRPVAIPGGNLGTQFIVEEFLSPTPFNIPRHNTPVPLSANYEIGGNRGTFPVALHDDIEIPNLRATIASVAGDIAGTPNDIATGQKIPATNFTRWTRHVVHDDQQFTNGVWYRIRITAIPPPLPEAVSP